MAHQGDSVAQNTQTRTRWVLFWMLWSLLLLATLKLGFWQLNRAQEKHTLLTQVQQGKTSIPLSFERFKDIPSPNAFQKVKLTGRWLDNTWLINNKHHEHQLGYHVIGAFEVDNQDESIILLNRGWVSRKDITNLKTPSLNNQTIELRSLDAFQGA